MTNEILKNVILTGYKFFEHNSLLIFGILGLGISGLRILIRPKRRTFLFFLGFLILIFSFEYEKHLIPVFFSHLLDPVVDPSTNLQTYYLGSLFLTKILPVSSQILGWVFIFSGIVF